MNLNLNFEVPPLILDNLRDVSTVRSDVSTVRSDVSTVQSRRANSAVDIQNIFQDENNEINFKSGIRNEISNNKYDSNSNLNETINNNNNNNFNNNINNNINSNISNNNYNNNNNNNNQILSTKTTETKSIESTDTYVPLSIVSMRVKRIVYLWMFLRCPFLSVRTIETLL